MTDLDALHFPPSDRAILRSFVAAWFEHGQPVLFAGAGLSKTAARKATAPKAAKFMSWSELSELLGRDLTGGDDDLKKRLPSNDLRLAELHQAQNLRQVLLDRIAQATPSEHFDPGDVHEQLARLPWAAVVTTNYDDLLERAFVRRRLRRVIWDPDLTQQRSPDDLLLIKMHGDRGDGKSIVLTEEDYRRYPSTRPGITVKVKQLLLEHPLLFVGFSLTDPNFTDIDGWIRDTVDAVKLPSVALMIPPVLPAERVMWQRRGVHLLAIEDDLSRVIEALNGEAASRSGAGRSRDRRAVWDASNEILQAISKKSPQWHREVATSLSKVTRETYGGALALRFALDGRNRGIPVHDVLQIVAALGDKLRQVLLTAYALGVTEVRGVDEVAFDVGAKLLTDSSLSSAERVAVLIQRARIARRQRDLEAARRDLTAARDLAKGKELQDEVDLETRELVILADDAQEMNSRLIEPPIEGHAFAYCRRGSDVLAMFGAERATQWYRQALDLAMNGDESTSALMGMQACLDWRSEHARIEDIQRQRLAIRVEDRPRAESVWNQRSLAAEQFMTGRRDIALTDLREAIDEADRMGWPRSARLSSSTGLDQLVDDAIRLLLAEDAELEEMKEAFTLIVRNGRRINSDLVTEETIARFLGRPGAAEWIRELLAHRPTSPPLTRRARELLTSANLAALTDDAIDAHVARVFLGPISGADDLDDEGRVELYAHKELLSRSWWFVPSATVKAILVVAIGAVSGRRRDQDLLDLPLHSWVRSGQVTAQDDAVMLLIDAVVEQMSGDTLIEDWHRRRAVLHLVFKMREEGLLSVHKGRVRASLDALLTRALALGAANENRESILLDVVFAVAKFEGWVPTEASAIAIVDLFPSVRNSTLAGQWALAVEQTVAACPASHVEALANACREYVQLSVAQQAREGLVHRPVWAGWMITAVATRADIMSKEEASRLLAELAKADSSVAVSVAEAGPSLAEGESLLEAEKVALRGWMRRNESPDSVVAEWVARLDTTIVLSPAMEDRLLSRLIDHDPRQRASAYHSLRALAERGRLSAEACRRLVRTSLEYGTLDPHYWVCSAAARALGAVGVLDREASTIRLTELKNHDLAPVRSGASAGLAVLDRL